MKDSKFQTWEAAVAWLTEQPEQKELVQACYYDTPLQNAVDRYWHSEEWQAIKQFLPTTPGAVLDIGAGNGISSYAFAKEGWQVSSLEPDPSNTVGTGAIKKIAADNQLNIQVFQEFGESLPFPDASFQAVFARQVLHHAQDLPQLCREIHRVLKPGGVFIGVRDHVISSKQDLPKFFEIHPLHKLYGGENAFLLQEYKQAINSSGLILHKVIGSFDSVINYAPYTKETLKKELQERFQKFPAGSLISNLLLNTYSFDILLSILSRVDQRPGRLLSFVGTKPE
jgi:ubiquinone/menaquinone biosynthesis C-methylase UbiE